MNAMPGFARSVSLLKRLGPASLINRVFLLVTLGSLLFVGGSLFIFLKFEFEQRIDEVETAAVMVVELVAQAVQDSVVIGDYETLVKTLDKAVQASVFKSASFIEVGSGRVSATSRVRPRLEAPAWLQAQVSERLYEVNRTVSVGGRDYGVIRLKFDTATVAGNIWMLTLASIGISLASLLCWLLLIRFPLRRWLGGLERLRGLVEDLGTGLVSVETLDPANEPLEIRRVVEMFNQTAGLVREREASRRALNDQKFALDQHAIVSITDVRGRIVYANDLFCAVSGYRAEEVIGNTHKIIDPGNLPDDFFRRLVQKIAGGSVWNGEVSFRRRDGKLRWVNATVVPFLGDDGKPAQYIAICTDISAMKEAEEAMLRAKESAEQANRVKSNFLANMSHEIRTPMNGIIGMTQLALGTELTREQASFLRMVKISADALLQIINDILDFSKLEAGRMDVEQIAFPLEQTLTELVRIHAVQANEKRLELLLNIAPDVPETIISDPGRLRQVLMNLLSNAIKFTEQGEVELTVTRRHHPDAGHAQLRFSVRDTGIGIPVDKFDAVFDAFSQVDSSTTRRYGGTGLGLSISSQLAGLLGGALHLESVMGKGSLFHLDLEVPVAMPARLPSLKPAGFPADTRVLVVDDNAANRGILCGMLASLHLQAMAVASGAEALVELDSISATGGLPALMLLDAQMPGMDGFEAARRIIAAHGARAPKIIMLSAEGRRGDGARCRELGISAYLTKPISRTEMLEAIVAVSKGAADEDNPQLVTRHSIREAKNPLRLLVAEDNEINQVLMTRLLEKEGHAVTIAPDGMEALRHWREQAYDAILMDVDMPRMNGYEAAQTIRAEEECSGAHIPILAITAHAIQGTQELCLAHGMDGYLSKPIHADKLLSALTTLMPRRDLAGRHEAAQ
jgi:PAS domain S-box-containing protein